uniref:Reverse transcriptase domain-containing protein n=1 Tax=Tanacetum cinerariifolium TaxID=118510 RepID=A0A6L2JHB1_TANCI|nr:hypothetical protein [Tanacetum cinerariifolium]
MAADTVVISCQRWRSMTVAGGGPPLTAAGPPLTTTGPPVNGEEDVDNFKRCCTSYTFDVGYRVLIDLIFHRSSINNSARLSNKFGGFYFIFKFGISGLLHQVITTIADRIRDSYNSNSLGFDQPQPPPSPVIHQPPQELSIQEMEDLKQQYLDELKRLSNLEYRDEIKIAELKENFNDEPVLSTEEPDNSLSMGDEHLDTILATESDEFIKSGVENLIPIPNEFEGIPEHVCDVPFHDNSPPLDFSNNQIEDFSESNEEFSSINDDSFSIDDIDYVEASPSNSELVSSEVMVIVILEVGGIDDDILLTIKDDILREKLLNVNLLIAKIEALNANPTPPSDCKTKSSSTSLNSLLEETNTFDNSLPDFETFCFYVEEISSGSTTIHPDISLPKYEAFHDDHVKEISSGSPTTHFDSSLYASFMFDLSINPFPPAVFLALSTVTASDFPGFATLPVFVRF